jgi:hypothetical protein
MPEEERCGLPWVALALFLTLGLGVLRRDDARRRRPDRRLHDLLDLHVEGFTLGRTGRLGIALLDPAISVAGGFAAAWGADALGRALRNVSG